MLCDCAALCATLATMLSVIRLVCRGPLLCYLLCCTPTLQHTRYQPTAPLSAISVMLSAMLLAMLPATLPAMLCAYTSLVPTSHTAVPVAQFLSEARGDGSWAFLRQVLMLLRIFPWGKYDPMHIDQRYLCPYVYCPRVPMILCAVRYGSRASY